MDFLKALIVVSEKAANIARLLRENEVLFKKLVEVKSDVDANPKFQEDFKTLADVLIQEMVKCDIGSQFPSIRDKIQGEESNHFFNQTINEEVIIEVKSTIEDTTKLLSSILDNDTQTAELLATAVHKEINIEEVNTKIPDQEFDIDISQLGIWIDPIDGTNEYVKGSIENKVDNFYLKGLKCVTVLIGVYNNEGQPVIGVINQPFFEKGVDVGYQCNWGVCCEHKNMNKEIKISSISQNKSTNTKVICVGSSENKTVLEVLKNAGYNLVVTRGAGYKLLTVVLGLADAYILSNPTTYYWDTCAPHAILKSLGGNIVEMKGLTNKKKNPLKYVNRSDATRDNKEGIIAYKNNKLLEKLMKLHWDVFNNS